MTNHLPECPHSNSHYEGSLMCSCTTANCAGCTCGCFHTPATRRSYWQGLYAAREAVAALDIGRKVRLADTLAAIDALRGER